MGWIIGRWDECIYVTTPRGGWLKYKLTLTAKFLNFVIWTDLGKHGQISPQLCNIYVAFLSADIFQKHEKITNTSLQHIKKCFNVLIFKMGTNLFQRK